MHSLKYSFPICNRCSRILRRHLTTEHPASPPPTPPHPAPYSPTGYALLTTRRLIALSGHDASNFLHGLTTTNIPSSSSRAGFYSAFLNARGRVLHDVFIYPTAHSSRYREWLNGSSEGGDDAGFLIEVDADQVRALAAHLKKYKIRARVRIRVVEDGEWEVWSAWRGDDGMTTDSRHSSSSPPAAAKKVAEEEADADLSTEIGCVDRRAPGMGHRVILPASKAKDTDKASHRLRTAGEKVSVESYEVHRILLGVAEGQAEIVRETALPLESNMDYMGGIDFRKGCYVGQELTIRTRHTGVVRKRILPVMLGPRSDSSGAIFPPPTRLEYKPANDRGVQPPSLAAQLLLPPRGANIAQADGRGRSAGKWLGGVGNIGLALCRLEVMTAGAPVEPEFKIAWEREERDPREAEEGNERPEGGKGMMSQNSEVRVTAFVPSWHGIPGWGTEQ